MMGAVLVVVSLLIAIATLLVTSMALRAQSRSGGRLPPERRAALRAAWFDLWHIEDTHGLDHTPAPWYLSDRLGEGCGVPPFAGIGTRSTGPR